MPSLKQRAIAALMATVLAIACGAVVGFLAGRALLLKQAQGLLDQYAIATIRTTDASSIESRSLLATVNASKFPFCSDAEISWLRMLIFQTAFMQDTGRLRDGKVVCSATLGALPVPVALSNPGPMQADGTRAAVGTAPYPIKGHKIVSLEAGSSYIVFNPYLEMIRADPAMYYRSTSANDVNRESARLPNQTVQIARAIFAGGAGGVRLRSVSCSERYFNCVAAYIPVSVALQMHHGELMACVALGVVIGGCLGFLISLLYRRNSSLENQLRRAIRKDELRMAYQPIVTLADRHVVGAEVLSRWNDEEGVPVGPDVFIKIAEEHKFIGDITRLVLRHVLRDFGEILRVRSDFTISLNVAAADLADPSFLTFLAKSLEQAGVPAQCLAIEITESCTALHAVAMGAIRQLRRRGHPVHIDDFGTGYSSLSYLHDLSVDAIKIDRSFTQAVGTEAVTVSILPQILAMAQTLKLKVIVEGIETTQQAEYFLTNSQPVLGQGWLYGHPVPAEDFCSLLLQSDADAA